MSQFYGKVYAPEIKGFTQPIMVDFRTTWTLQKSTRVRWILAIGWWAFGFLFVFTYWMGEPPPPIVLVGYPFGIVIGGVFWAAVYQVIGWFCVRVWRFFRERK